jgi:hypothetical protein
MKHRMTDAPAYARAMRVVSSLRASSALVRPIVDLKSVSDAATQLALRLSVLKKARMLEILIDDVLDEGLPVVSAVLAGEIAEEYPGEFNEMLDDPVMRIAFGPVVAAWQAPDTVPPVTLGEVDAAWTRFRARVGLDADGGAA